MARGAAASAIRGRGRSAGPRRRRAAWADDPVFGYGQRLLELRAEYEQHGRLRDWYSQYQGRPRPPEGAMFKPGRMPVFDAIPPGARVLEEARGWDLASSAGRGDWTVGLKLARLWGDARYEDMYRDHRRAAHPRHAGRGAASGPHRRRGRRPPGETVVPRGPGQAGKDQATATCRC